MNKLEALRTELDRRRGYIDTDTDLSMEESEVLSLFIQLIDAIEEPNAN